MSASEESAEDVLKPAEVLKVDAIRSLPLSAARTPAENVLVTGPFAADAGRAELVVLPALVRVSEDTVSAGYLFELLLGGLAAALPVGMVFLCEAAICLADLLRWRGSRNPALKVARSGRLSLRHSLLSEPNSPILALWDIGKTGNGISRRRDWMHQPGKRKRTFRRKPRFVI